MNEAERERERERERESLEKDHHQPHRKKGVPSTM
jgi:hypothetical protein